jgi:hypothetical protein
MTITSLPTMAEVNALRRAAQKHAVPTIKATKAKEKRTADKVVVDVRAQCVTRDGTCRYAKDVSTHRCNGPSEWAHLGDKRRSKTRGQAPEVRHTTAGSLMLCQQAHAQYDGRQRPRLSITATTKRGADGPLRYREAKSKGVRR